MFYFHLTCDGSEVLYIIFQHAACTSIKCPMNLTVLATHTVHNFACCFTFYSW